MKTDRLKSALSGNEMRTLSVAIPLLQAVFALLRKRPKRALLLVGVALVSSRSTKLGTVAQVLLRFLSRR
ncbi:hypothetical protein SAMN04487947_0627 [Halogeometricum rufum]|jgi:hypothetical protein|uniref:Uncharacterized protein n=1 Tax=Halogeometricum rufum TaxID=553469 RepID=A0A1I6G614_9EURY|nr:hypothetical protein [Halogeometricum rufum]SFR37624.1 hypothetical protein SAMN04487947_0627 [Halogeometricum rufum]